MLVASYGGSLIFTANGLNPNVEKFVKFLSDKKGIVVTGGGTVARTYIKSAKALGITDHAELDRLAIEVTRLNASLLQRVLSKSNKSVSPAIPYDEASLAEEAKKFDLVFMGGTLPGQTTDMVALKLCVALGEKKLYNLTKVDGIYTANPHEDESATLIKKATCSEIVELWGINEHKPGLNYPIEPQALSFAKNHGIEIFILNGNDVKNFENLIAGKDWRGTHLLAE